MRSEFFYMPDLPDKEGRPIPFRVQILSYLIWTAPERGLTMRGFRKVFRRVAAHFGVRVGFWSTLWFTRNTVRIGRATRSWIRAEYHLDDDQMDRRQITVFQEGLRGTGFDKMDRIRERAVNGTPFSKMGPQTCDMEALFAELPGMDLSHLLRSEEEAMRKRDKRVTIPAVPVKDLLRSLDEANEAARSRRMSAGGSVSDVSLNGS
jgi:hypothetical protein